MFSALMYLLLSLAFANPQLHYEQELENRVLIDVMQNIEAGEHRKVQSTLKAFDTEVFPSSRLSYEVGLLYNRLGDLERALEYYNRALQINPNDIGALYDRAEIEILQGNTGMAKTDLKHILLYNQQQNTPQPSQYWVIHFRLAQIAGLESNSQDLEQHLLAAIKWNMDLDILRQDKAQWSQFAKDPKISSALHAIFVLMAKEDLWEELLQ